MQLIERRINQTGGLEVVMTDCLPAVYLDHWALRVISSDPGFAMRLKSCIRGANGTLAVSGFNILEFIRMTDKGQAEEAENLLESVLPSILFLDCNPLCVIKREDEPMCAGPSRFPEVDCKLLDVFLGLKPSSIEQVFTVRGLFSAVQGAGLAGDLDHVCDTVIARVEERRSELTADPVLKRNMESSVKGPPIQRGTRYVLREVVRILLRDNQTRLTRNDAIDLFHTVVPVSYCQLVLLDKHWHHLAVEATKRIRSAHLPFPMAECFTGKGDGVNRFLTEFEKRVSAEPTLRR